MPKTWDPDMWSMILKPYKFFEIVEVYWEASDLDTPKILKIIKFW
jgi:hypothetical protein